MVTDRESNTKKFSKVFFKLSSIFAVDIIAAFHNIEINGVALVSYYMIDFIGIDEFDLAGLYMFLN